MQNNQSTAHHQGRSPKSAEIRAQPFEELMAKYANGFPPRTAEQRAKYSVEGMMAAWDEAETWWPEQSRAILEDCRRIERVRKQAEDDLLRALQDAGLLKRNVKRRDGEDILESVWRVANAMAAEKRAKAARPKLSRTAMLYLERQKARS